MVIAKPGPGTLGIRGLQGYGSSTAHSMGYWTWVLLRAMQQSHPVELPRHWHKHPGTLFDPAQGAFHCRLLLLRGLPARGLRHLGGHEASSYLTPLRSEWAAPTSK